MTPAELAQARRWAASPWFMWRPGMRWIASRPAPFDDVTGMVPVSQARDVKPYPGAVPLLSDALTAQALWLDVKRAYGGRVVIMDGDGRFHLETPEWTWGDATAATLTDALLAALEAATAPKDGRETPPTRGGA